MIVEARSGEQRRRLQRVRGPPSAIGYGRIRSSTRSTLSWDTITSLFTL